MNRKLQQAVLEQKQQTQREVQKLPGILGIPLGGQNLVEVPSRNSYVYVRLRNNNSEVIQAFNNQVAPAYNLPVLVERQGNKYVVIGVDTARYENNWTSFTPFLPRHGNTHSFDIETGGGGDIVWVYPRQFMPSLVFPSGSTGGASVIVSPYTLRKDDGTWRYVGNTGTGDITIYNPVTGTQAAMVLVYLDSTSGNPYLLVGSGTYFANTITGSSAIVPYIPTDSNPTHIPLAAIRLITGTSHISWDNIYDVRQFIHNTPTGTGGGGGPTTNPPITGSVVVKDEGAAQGSALVFNFVGDNVQATVSGNEARIFVTGSGGGSSNLTGTTIGTPNKVVLTNSAGQLFAPDWLKWGVDDATFDEFVEFGANVPDKNEFAGRVGYQMLGGSIYLDILGAGTGSSEKRVKIYDDLHVQQRTYTPDLTITNLPGVYVLGTDGSGNVQNGASLLGNIVTGTMIQDEGVNKGVVNTINFVGDNVDASVVGATARVFITGSTGGGSWELIEDINLTGGDQASFDFQNIPSIYKHLKILLSGRSTRAGQVSDSVVLKANNDGGSSYYGYVQWRTGFIEQAAAGVPATLFWVGAANTPANFQSNAEITVFDYTNTNRFKTWQSRGMDFENSVAGNFFIYDGGGIWASLSVLARVTLSPSNGSWKQYSRATLYGLK